MRLTPLLVPRLALPFALIGVPGCALQSASTRLAGGPESVDVQLEPAVLHSGQEAAVVVRSPTADSIAIESANGLDRYWNDGPRLHATLRSDFGDPIPVRRFAERRAVARAVSAAVAEQRADAGAHVMAVNRLINPEHAGAPRRPAEDPGE